VRDPLRFLSRGSSLPLLLTAGLIALVLAWRLAGMHRADVFVTIMLAIWFVGWMCAFVLVLRKRDQRRVVQVRSAPAIPFDPALADTVYGLQAGTEYRVMQPFSDFHGGQFARDERLHFKRRNFLPYHGGHTIEFDERTLYLQEDANCDILGDFARYIARVE